MVWSGVTSRSCIFQIVLTGTFNKIFATLTCQPKRSLKISSIRSCFTPFIRDESKDLRKKRFWSWNLLYFHFTCISTDGMGDCMAIAFERQNSIEF